MNRRWTTTIAVGTLLIAASGSAQVTDTGTTVVARFVDRINGLSLDQAIARALELEPSLRSARSAIDVAKGMRQQAALRPSPSASFERREEPSGTDNQTMVAVEWPLDLFRKSGRVTVADREVAATEQSVADRERLLAAEARMRYGEVLVAVRELTVLDELVSATRRQHELLRSRVAEGATPPLERDLVEIELRRVEADRLLQTGRTEAAVFALKRVLGIEPDAPFGATRHAGRRCLVGIRPAIRWLVGFRPTRRRARGGRTHRDRRRENRPCAARGPVRRQPVCELRAHGCRLSAAWAVADGCSRARPRHFSLRRGWCQADAAHLQSKPGRDRHGASRTGGRGCRISGGTPDREDGSRRRGCPRRPRARGRNAVPRAERRPWRARI